MEPDSRSILDVILKIAQLAVLAAVMVAIVMGLMTMSEMRRQMELHFRMTRLIHLKELRGMVDESRKLDGRIKVFLDRIPGADGTCAAGSGCLPKPEELFEQSHKIGRDMYHSEELKEFVEIGRLYEDLGALIRLGYGDFDFAYTLLNFPDEFWERTGPYRHLIQDNWGGEQKPLPDFWMNFSWLRDEYLKERRKAR
jgi:hypothetical protein